MNDQTLYLKQEKIIKKRKPIEATSDLWDFLFNQRIFHYAKFTTLA